MAQRLKIQRLRNELDTLSDGYTPATGAGTARTLLAKVRDIISVKDFGAAGDGVTDDTAAIQAAVTFSKANKIFNIGENSGPRGGVTIYFPAGMYKIASSITLDNINGITFRGSGKESTVLVHTDSSGSMFDINQMLFTTFENLSFAAGTISTNSLGALTIAYRAAGSRTTDLFDWNTNAGGDRFNVWQNCHVLGGFARVWDVGGSNTHSENSIVCCHFFLCDYVWYSDNVQSLNTYFTHCDAEFIDTSVFYYAKGGYLCVTGGSYIVPVDTLTLAGTDADIGTGSGQFIFRNVKWEMYQNIDATKSPKLLNSTSTAYAHVTFENCSNNAGSPDAAKTFISVVSAMRITIEKCDFVGVIATTPNAGNMGTLEIRDCRLLPTVTRNLNNGSRYKVIYDNVGERDDPILNKAVVDDDSSRVFSYQKNAVRLKVYQTISSATTTSLTFDVPSGVIFNSAIISVARGGAVALTATAFMDAGKTFTLFTQDCGALTTHKMWNPAITYTAANTADYVSGSTLYVDLVTGGNAGLVQMVITLEYISHG
jgi:hypothetical protein